MQNLLLLQMKACNQDKIMKEQIIIMTLCTRAIQPSAETGDKSRTRTRTRTRSHFILVNMNNITMVCQIQLGAEQGV